MHHNGMALDYVGHVDRAQYARALDILVLAFQDDPGFRRVAGERRHSNIGHMVRASLDFHVSGGNPIRGVTSAGELLAVSLVEEPGSSLPYAGAARTLCRLLLSTGPRVTLWSLRTSLATLRKRPREPHHFLSMIAVHPKAQGSGLGRILLEHLHADCQAHPDSSGVALDTSNPRNIGLYEKFGYRVVEDLGLRGLQAWYMFRPRDRDHLLDSIRAGASAKRTGTLHRAAKQGRKP